MALGGQPFAPGPLSTFVPAFADKLMIGSMGLVGGISPQAGASQTEASGPATVVICDGQAGAAKVSRVADHFTSAVDHRSNPAGAINDVAPQGKILPYAPMSALHPSRISVKLNDLNQLFNSMDPSPFLDRDLDDDAAEFIVSSAWELHGGHSLELVIHLGTAPDAQRAADTESAVQHFFAARAELKRRDFRLLLRHAHTALAIGLLFMAGCLFLSGLATKLPLPSLAPILREGLIIVGWVAMWRPLEMYLYDWWPVREQWRHLQRLARMQVRVVPPRNDAGEARFTAVQNPEK
ncbi:MAG: hypothetical protein JWM88_1558 [Verrucomicrobia bacterium]|nr:hypothetical protein [Verrucomicrobiota bacterium]